LNYEQVDKNSIRHCGLDPQYPDDNGACPIVKTKGMLKQVTAGADLQSVPKIQRTD